MTREQAIEHREKEYLEVLGWGKKEGPVKGFVENTLEEWSNWTETQKFPPMLARMWNPVPPREHGEIILYIDDYEDLMKSVPFEDSDFPADVNHDPKSDKGYYVLLHEAIERADKYSDYGEDYFKEGEHLPIFSPKLNIDSPELNIDAGDNPDKEYTNEYIPGFRRFDYQKMLDDILKEHEKEILLQLL